MAEISGIQTPVVTPRSNNQNMNQQLRTDVGGLRNDINTVIADPNRVVRTGGQDVNTGEEAYRYEQDSNYESFVRTLRSMPELGELFSDVFMTKLTNSVTLATYGEEFANCLCLFEHDLFLEGNFYRSTALGVRFVRDASEK